MEEVEGLSFYKRDGPTKNMYVFYILNKCSTLNTIGFSPKSNVSESINKTYHYNTLKSSKLASFCIDTSLPATFPSLSSVSKC